jgi:uncharacterized membrane protein
MKYKQRLILLTIIIGIAILIGGLFLDVSQPSVASDGPSTGISLGVEASDKLVIRLYYDNQEQLNAVAGNLDIWEVHRPTGIGINDGYAVAAVFPAQKDWLEVQGYRLEVDQEKTDELRSPTAKLDERYYYFDPYNNNNNNRYIVSFLQDIEAAYPNITELIDIGDAWLSTQPGGYHRDMWVLRISNEDPAYGAMENKPPFFMTASVHAREVTTPEMAIRYIKYFTSGYNGQGGYGIDPDVTWLVNHHIVYLLVTHNPDGRAINEADWYNYWRKNVDNNDGCTDQSSWGTDLNRNSSFKWGCCGGSSGQPCAETYRGPSRASEPETAAFQAYIASVVTDWNGNNGDDEIPPASPTTASGIFITLHSYQDEILWPFGFSPGGAPNNAQLQTIGRKLADITGVMDPTGFLYTVDGSTDDWVYGKLGIAAFTYEIGPTYGSCGDFFPAYGCQEGIDGMPRNFWAEMRPSFIYAHKIAGSPYKTAYGPDTQSVNVDPFEVPGGVAVDLSATILDQRYGSDPLQTITSAEYFIDAPGVDGTGITMSPTDGAWGETNESVDGVIDTSGLSEGKHYILVHGKNDDGVWGPFTAVFLTITTPSYGVMLTPESAVTQEDPGVTVTYQMQVNNIGLNTDSYAISVTGNWTYAAPSTTDPIAPGESATFNVEVTIPSDALNGEFDIATVTVTSDFNPNVSDTSVLTTTANYYALSLSPASAQANGYPGGQISYILHVTNMGNTTDTFTLMSTNIWDTTLPASVGPLESGNGVDFNVVVDIPTSAAPGEFDLAVITATSQGDGSKVQNSALTTTAIQAGPVVNPASDSASGDPGTQVIYTLTLENHNYLPDTFTVSVASEWDTDYPVTVGPIPANSSSDVQITVNIPVDAAGGASDVATVTFTSSLPDLPTASAILTTTTNNVYSFQVTPLEDTLTGYGRGVTVEYTVLVTNTGNMADTYNIYVFSSDWTVNYPANVGPLSGGETVPVTITVQVPFDAVMGDSNDARLMFISQGSFIDHQFHLFTNTFWYSNFLPVTTK